MKKQLLSLTLFSLIALGLSAQNVGIGTNNPQTKLDINGALSTRVTSVAAAANVTIPDNVTLFRLTNTAGGGATTLSLTTPKEGQLLIIMNEDDGAVSFNGHTIPAGTAANPSVGNFIYIGGATPGWKRSSDNNTGSNSFTAGDGLSWSGNTLNSVWTQNGSNDIYNNNSSNKVGIGTNAPAGTLDVQGGTAPANTNGTNIIMQAQNGGTGTTVGGSVSINSGTGNVSPGIVDINGTGTGRVDIAAGANAQTVNINTGAANKTTNVGSANSGSTTNINAGTGGVNVSTLTAGGLVKTDGSGRLSNGVTATDVPVTNTLSLSGNTLTSTVNGVAANSSTVSGVSNSSSGNTITTTVNGVTGSAANIINSNALSLSGTTLTSSVNGVSSAGVDISPAVTSKAWSLTGNSSTAPTAYSDNAAQSGNFIGSTDNQAVEIYTNANAANNKSDLRLYNSTSTGSVVTTPADIVHVRRNGTSGVNYPQVASFALGKYGNSITSETELAIRLAAGGTYVPDMTVMTMRANGNVGIGTTNPANRLEVRSDGTGAAWAGRLALSNSTADRQVFLGTYNGNSVVASHNFALNAWAPLYVNAVSPSGGGDVIMSGNVGIGTSPGYKLDVAGAVNATGGGRFSGSLGTQYGGTTTILASAANATGGGISIADDGGFYDYNDGWVTYNGSTGLKIAGNNGAGTTGTLNIVNLGSGLVKATGGTLGLAGAGDLPAGSGNYIQNQQSANQGANFRINGEGNINAGNPFATPNNYMAAGSLTIGDQSVNYGGGNNWSGNTAGLLLEAADNTEIAVHDAGQRVASLMYYQGGGVNQLTIGRNMYWGNIARTNFAGDNYAYFGPNSTWGEYLQVGGNGRVTTGASVATTNGNLHLDAKNGSFATYINWYSQNNTYINGQGGNVGIGTNNPSQKLEVIGNVSVPGSQGYSIYTWAGNDANWRIGMSDNNATVGFSRALATSHVQYATFASGAGQGFAVGDKSSGLSSFEVTGSGSGYKAYFRGNVGIGIPSAATRLEVASVGANISAAVIHSTGGNAWGNTLTLATDAASGDEPRINFSYRNKTKQWQIGGYSNSNRFSVWEDGGDGVYGSGWGSEGITVLPGGNVGINNNNPLAKLHVSGGAIRPEQGNNNTAGINFGQDIYGGGGDQAWIRYYQDGAGEDTRLVIGNENDGNDEIGFYQAGAERMAINGGVVEVKSGLRLQKKYTYYRGRANEDNAYTYGIGQHDFCYLAGNSIYMDNNVTWDLDVQCNVFPTDWNSTVWGDGGNQNQLYTTGPITYGYGSKPTWNMYVESYIDPDAVYCGVICIDFD